MNIFNKTLILALIIFGLSNNVLASSILVSQGTYVDTETYGYGGSAWSYMTAEMDLATGNNVDVASDFSNLNLMLNYNALWLDLRTTSSVLSASEIDNLRSYILMGGNVVLIGENPFYFNSWNQSILSTVYGSADSDNYSSGLTSTAFSHDLTSGVDSIRLGIGGLALGGTSLFDINAATLWGDGNVVSILDVNTCDDSHWNDYDNSVFCGNLARWAAAPSAVPVPAPAWLLGSGILTILGISSHRRRLGRKWDVGV